LNVAITDPLDPGARGAGISGDQILVAGYRSITHDPDRCGHAQAGC